MPIVLEAQSTTSVIVIEVSSNKFIPKFFHSTNILEFWKRSHEQLLLLMSLVLEALNNISIN
jgi:hypothetical protein